MLGDEGAAPLLDAQKTLVGERRDRAAHGVPVDRVAARQIEFGRQTVAGLERARQQIRAQPLGDLAPQGDPGTALHMIHLTGPQPT